MANARLNAVFEFCSSVHSFARSFTCLVLGRSAGPIRLPVCLLSVRPVCLSVRSVCPSGLTALVCESLVFYLLVKYKQ